MFISIFFRVNGTEVGSFYDQNHESNHKNSMVGQSVLIDCKQGDKVQVITTLRLILKFMNF